MHKIMSSLQKLVPLLSKIEMRGAEISYGRLDAVRKVYDNKVWNTNWQAIVGLGFTGASAGFSIFSGIAKTAGNDGLYHLLKTGSKLAPEGRATVNKFQEAQGTELDAQLNELQHGQNEWDRMSTTLTKAQEQFNKSVEQIIQALNSAYRLK